MANKAKNTKENKNMLIGVCCAVAAIIVVVVVAVVLAVNNNGGISDDYFKSDDTKYVLTVETDADSVDESEAAYTPIRTHVVYTYEGDTITGMKTYAEYADAAAAKKALEALKEAGSEEVSKAELKGKYIVITSSEDSYSDMSTSDVKSYIDFVNTLKNMDLDSYTAESADESADESTTDTTENTEE